MREQARVVAVLGPTNTGKTHYAIERMLAHRTGVIGLPLRLLAREVYDRIVGLRGPSVVALITGEERIVPDRVKYWVCTVEAMPTGIGADFVAVDEIQLCADADRGHVFTERLLGARGLHETLFLGSDTMRGAIAALVPGVQFLSRPRLSDLAYSGSKKISRMPPRSAIVGFSVENVYAIAELIRRQKGGCAVVMGALSPRTRNAQVALYQNGDVDYLVATDAIGMGLNLDIHHVAFSALSKFDGHRMRPLYPHELAQIAGRAGRHMNPGTFGVTGEARAPDPEVIAAIEDHRFEPVTRLHWRNAALSFGSIDRLIASLESYTHHDWLTRVRESDDLRALRALAAMPEVRDRVQGGRDVHLLWDVCTIPDFRGISAGDHAGLLARIFDFLQGGGLVPDDWIARQIARIDRVDGDIDTVSRRLADIRTWTYIAQRRGWVNDETHWRGATRAVEDRLSDALHARLTQRFVDRRTSVLLRRLNQKESLVAEVNDKGDVTIEGEFIGRLEGFRFRTDASASGEEAKTLRAASLAALRPQFHLRADRFYNAPDTEMDYTEQGGLMWGDQAVGKLVAGAEALRPKVEAFVDEDAGEEVAEKVRRRLQHFIDRKIAALFDPLLALGRDETLTGLARGFAFRLTENFGILPRDQVAEDVRALDQEARGSLRKHGVRFGQFTVFLPLLLKPAPTRLRLVLWSLAQGLQEFPESPPPGLVTIPNIPDVPDAHYQLAGYRPSGARAIRIDMLERLADLLRAKDSRAGFEATGDMLSITGLSLEQFVDLMGGLGYRAERGERPKARPLPDAGQIAAPDPVKAPDPVETPDPAAPTEVPGRPDEVPAPLPPEVPVESPPESPPEPPVELPDNPGAETAAQPDAAPAEPAAPVETEVFFTFRWGPQRPPRQNRPPRKGRAAEAVAPADAPAEPARKDRRDNRQKAGPGDGSRHRDADSPQGGKPQGGKPQGDRPRGHKPGHKPGAKSANRQNDQRQVHESRPPREQKIDPDNPFAVLAALKNRL
jgi:ATP-dependent RNA helicase SUPV3L1/SUV3